jgi:hypothetical protein
MSSIREDLDHLDRLVDGGAAKDEIRSQIRLIDREVAALEADYTALREQNAQLRAQSQPTSDPPMDHRRGLYYVGGDAVPFCPHCWEAWERKIHLSGPVQLFDSTRERWDCYTCKTVYSAGPNENFLPHPIKT